MWRGVVVMIKLFGKSFFSATATQHCLNESHERKSRALTIPWRHHTLNGMHYKTCISFFSSVPQNFFDAVVIFFGELVGGSCRGMYTQGDRGLGTGIN